jgi:hypothetical protein
MKNNYLIPLIGFLLVLLVTSTAIQAHTLPEGLNTVGVNNGESFNIKVLENTLDLSQFEDADLGFDFADVGLEELALKIYDAIQNKTVVPEAGDIIVVTVKEVPSATADGSISLSLEELTADLATGFLIGTPVTYTNWDVWETYLNELKDTVTTEGEITIGLDINQIGDYFRAEVDLDFSNKIPVDLSQLFDELKVKIIVKYEKTSGIQEMMQVNVTTDGPSVFSKGSTSLSYERTEEQPPEPTTTTENNGTGPDLESIPGFEFFIPVITIGIVSVAINRRRKRN